MCSGCVLIKLRLRPILNLFPPVAFSVTEKEQRLEELVRTRLPCVDGVLSKLE